MGFHDGKNETSEILAVHQCRGYQRALAKAVPTASLGQSEGQGLLQSVHGSPRWKTPLQMKERWISPQTLFPRTVWVAAASVRMQPHTFGLSTDSWCEHRACLGSQSWIPPQGSVRQGNPSRQPWLLPGWVGELWPPSLALHRDGCSAQLSCPLSAPFSSSALQRPNCRKSAQLCNKRSCHALIHSDSISKKNHLADLDKD